MSRRPPITTLPDTRFPYPTLFRSVDVAVAVLDQLDHFGSARRGGDTGAAHELAIEGHRAARATRRDAADAAVVVDELNEDASRKHARSEEHTSELQSLMHISYAVFCLKKKNTHTRTTKTHNH